MKPELIPYQKFNDAVLASELTGMLEKHNIEHYMQEESSGFDPSFVMSNAPVDYVVKLRAEDFEKVNKLLIENEARHLGEIDKDYYLFSFTNDELSEVIAKADEWSPFDNVLARRILGERGIQINEKDIANEDEKRIKALKIIKPLSTWQLVICYMFAIGGGLIGIPIWWHMITAKKILPDGERVYGYTEDDRWHGRIILYLSIADFVLALLYRLEIIRN